MQKNSGVQSLDRTFYIIEILSKYPDGLPLLEISNLSGLHKSTVHRLLSSLIIWGYVKKNNESNYYKLTLKLYELSGRIISNMDVVKLSVEPMKHLRDLCKEAVHLVVREGVEIVYVHKIDGLNSNIRMFSRIGMRRYMHCTGVGKCMLASLSDQEIKEIWDKSVVKKYTEHTITKLEDLYSELETVRKLGYAMDNEENELGVKCIAAPIYDYSGKCNHALSISAPIVRMSDERISILVPMLLKACNIISKELGYQQTK